MGRRAKLERFRVNRQSDNVIDRSEDGEALYGRWATDYFQNDHPITLELACGRGEYTVALASEFPNRNYIGVDLKGDRIYVGSQLAKEKNLSNVAFIRSRIEMLPAYFGPGEIDEIWLTFPDPHPRLREEKHRLTNINFINLYKSLLAEDGWFRFKTDNTPLFDFGLECIEPFNVREIQFTHDLYQSELLSEHHGIKTKYEKIWTDKGEKIKYWKLRF